MHLANQESINAKTSPRPLLSGRFREKLMPDFDGPVRPRYAQTVERIEMDAPWKPVLKKLSRSLSLAAPAV